MVQAYDTCVQFLESISRSAMSVMILPLCVPASSSLWRGDFNTTNSSTLTEQSQSLCKYLKPKVLGSSLGRVHHHHPDWEGGLSTERPQSGQKQTDPYYLSSQPQRDHCGQDNRGYTHLVVSMKSA